MTLRYKAQIQLNKILNIYKRHPHPCCLPSQHHGFSPHVIDEPWGGLAGTAVVNTIAITIFTLLVAILLAYSISRSGGGLDSNLIFFDGDCTKRSSINIWLHLLLNACSTGIIASSNFFMQALSWPARHEVDKVHREATALEIGVPSLSNLFQVA